MKNFKIIIYVFFIILIDQISKFLVVKYLKDNIVIIKNLLSFVFVKNTGAAFGILSSNIILLILISCIIIFYLINELKKKNVKKLELFALSTILGGALGNLIDRILRGYVVDFISFNLFNNQMPVFNISDTFITIGIILQIIVIIMEEKNEKNKNN